MVRVKIERTINAPIERVWAAAIDFMKSPHPSMTIVPEKAGDPEANGAGAERTVVMGKSRVHERLEAVSPQSYFTYRILSGVPIRDHSGRVDFRADGGATVVKWEAQFIPLMPGTGWVVGRVIRGVINKFIDAMG